MKCNRKIFIMRFLTILVLCSIVVTGFTQTNVLTGTVGNYGLSPQAGVTVKLTLVSPNPRVVNGILVQRNPITAASATDGTFAFTNIIWGKYTLSVGTSPTDWTVEVGTNTLGEVPIGSLAKSATPAPPNPATNYYTMPQVDALIAGVHSGGTLPENVLTNDYSGQIRAEEFIGSIQASNIVGLVASDNAVNTSLAPGGGNLQFVGPLGTNLLGQAHPNTVALATNWPANAGTNGFPLWLVFTGSTNFQWQIGGPAYEDPMLYASRDGGVTWVPRGRQPLVTKLEATTIAGFPTNAWQADTELYLDPSGIMRILWCSFYQLNSSNYTSALLTMSSTNGTDWSTPTVLRTSNVRSNATWAGPQIVATATNTLRLYFVDDDNYGSNALIYVRGNDLSGTNWNWGETNFCTLNPYLTNSLAPWHFDMVYRAGRYHMIYGSQSESSTEYTTSADGVTWAATGMGFFPVAQLTNYGGTLYTTYKSAFWPSVASETAWNCIVGFAPQITTNIPGYAFKLLKDFTPTPQTWSYRGANTNEWILYGGDKSYLGISRPAAMTVYEQVGPGDAASFSLGYHSSGYAGFQAGTTPLKGSTSYSLRGGAGYTIVNAVAGNRIDFRMSDVGVASAMDSGLVAWPSKAFWGNGWGLSNVPPAAVTGRLASAQMALSITASSVTTTNFTVIDTAGTTILDAASDSPGTLTGTGVWALTGTNAATFFKGDGSGLTNLAASSVVSGALALTNSATTNTSVLTLTDTTGGWNERLVSISGGLTNTVKRYFRWADFNGTTTSLLGQNANNALIWFQPNGGPTNGPFHVLYGDRIGTGGATVLNSANIVYVNQDSVPTGSAGMIVWDGVPTVAVPTNGNKYLTANSTGVQSHGGRPLRAWKSAATETDYIQLQAGSYGYVNSTIALGLRSSANSVVVLDSGYIPLATFSTNALTLATPLNAGANTLTASNIVATSGGLTVSNAIATAGTAYNGGGPLLSLGLGGTNATPVMTITNGLVGIGTNSPKATLHVAGTVILDGGTNASGVTILGTGNSSDNGRPMLLIWNTNGGTAYTNECHVRLRAGTTAEGRAYIGWQSNDGADKWLMGKNDGSAFILYEVGQQHRVFMPGMGYSVAAQRGISTYSSLGTNDVRINWYPSAGTTNHGSMGSGGLSVWSPGALEPFFVARGDGIRTLVPITASNIVATAGSISISTNAFIPTPVAGLGMLWNSNSVLYWVTSAKTNLVSDGRP